MTEIDFLPAEYWKQRQSRRDQWYLLAIGLASLFPLLSSFLHESNTAAELHAEMKKLNEQHHEAVAQVEKVEKLKNLCAPMAFDARLHALLRARPSLSRAVTAIATSCPPHLSLRSVRVRPVKLAKTATTLPGTATTLTANPTTDPLVEQLERFATDRQSTRLSIELIGVAESDLDIAELIERLESAGCFREVNLSTVDYQATGVFELREFKIQCRLAEIL